MYLKTIKILVLYVSTQFKNGSNVKKCLKQVVPDLMENHTSHEKSLWYYPMNELMNTVRIFKTNLCNLFAALISLFNSDTKNQVEASTEYEDLEMSLDSMRLLTIIKKLVYTRGTKN